MRFSIAVMVAATGAMLLTGGIAVASALDDMPVPRPIGFPAAAAAVATTPGAGLGR
jgi:hypothetical protein